MISETDSLLNRQEKGSRNTSKKLFVCFTVLKGWDSGSLEQLRCQFSFRSSGTLISRFFLNEEADLH